MTFYLLLSAVSIALGTYLPLPQLVFFYILTFLLLVVSYRIKHLAHRRWPMLLIMVVGTVYGSGWVHWQLAHRLPLEYDKTEVDLTLLVVENKEQGYVQKLQVEPLSSSKWLAEQGMPNLRNLRVSLYRANESLLPGAVIDAKVMLRSPRNIENGLAFDYEAWLLSKKVDATGYIKEYTLVSYGSPTLRSQFIQSQQQRLPTYAWHWISGLILGEQDSFSPQQWQLAKRTGTLHLLVVSGLHMGLILLLLVLLWRTFQRLLSFILKRNIPNLLIWQQGFLIAGGAGYLWLAGSGVALQRSWLMFTALILINGTRFKLNWMTTVASALLLVIILNPLAWVSAGFAYSFAAVLTLLVFYNGRKSTLLESSWLPQWVIFVALIPIFILWNQPVSVSHLLANIIAIPYVTLVLIPLSLLTLFVPADLLAELLSVAGSVYWEIISQIDFIPLSRLIVLPNISLILWPLLLWLLRRGVSYLLAAGVIISVMIILFTVPAKNFPVAMMVDVGQGQSVFFNSDMHTLLYDTGPFMGSFDTGESIITPVLNKHAVSDIDVLIVSHNDNDHAGGTESIINNFLTSEIYSGQSLAHTGQDYHLCSMEPARWQVLTPDILYRYLSLNDTAWSRLPDNNNNRSCVVQVEWFGNRFLLTGDISKAVEYDLIRQYGKELASDILVVSHHGSDTSSSKIFLQTVAPRQAWISAGFNNAFNHPTKQVIDRLEQLNIDWLNTADKGAIVLTQQGSVKTMRDGLQPAWRQSSGN